jgi:hypothetical protein
MVEASVVTVRVWPNSVTTLIVVAVKLETVPLSAKANCPNPGKGQLGPDRREPFTWGTGVDLDGVETVASTWLPSAVAPELDVADAIP